MKCPYCGSIKDRVIDSRAGRDQVVIRRRRMCGRCGKRFTTYERLEDPGLSVVSSGGGREPFDPKKLLARLQMVCAGLHVAETVFEELTREIETLIRQSPEHEITKQEIAGHVMQQLLQVNKVAYLRYASLFRNFQNLDDYLEEIRKVKGS